MFASVVGDGVTLSPILEALTRYSANDRRLPVNDRSALFRSRPIDLLAPSLR